PARSPSPSPTRRSSDLAAEAVRRTSESAHGTPDAVRIMLATKTQPASRIRVALEAGHTLIGENRVQELQAKAPELADIAHEAHRSEEHTSELQSRFDLV